MAKIHLITVDPESGIQLHSDFDPWPIIIDYAEIQKHIDCGEYAMAETLISMQIEEIIEYHREREVKRQLGRLYTLWAEVQGMRKQ